MQLPFDSESPLKTLEMSAVPFSSLIKNEGGHNEEGYS